jgi:hypothetical protein
MAAVDRYTAEAHRHIAQSFLTELLGQLSPDTPSQRAALAKHIVEATDHVDFRPRGSQLVLTFNLADAAVSEE